MIKKLFLALLLATITSVAFAQTTKDSTATQNDNVMYKTVEKNLNIKDNMKDEDITYNFDATLFESHHDLYIQVNYKGKDGTSVMDF